MSFFITRQRKGGDKTLSLSPLQDSMIILRCLMKFMLSSPDCRKKGEKTRFLKLCVCVCDDDDSEMLRMLFVLLADKGTRWGEDSRVSRQDKRQIRVHGSKKRHLPLLLLQQIPLSRDCRFRCPRRPLPKLRSTRHHR